MDEKPKKRWFQSQLTYDRWLAQRWVLICNGSLFVLASPMLVVVSIDRRDLLGGSIAVAALWCAAGIGAVWWGFRTLRRGYQGDKSKTAFPKKWDSN